MKLIRKKLITARKKTGMSQTEAGAAIGVSQGQISKYEDEDSSGSIGHEHLGGLALLYGVSVAYFFEPAENNKTRKGDDGTMLNRIRELEETVSELKSEKQRLLGIIEKMAGGGGHGVNLEKKANNHG